MHNSKTPTNVQKYLKISKTHINPSLLCPLGRAGKWYGWPAFDAGQAWLPPLKPWLVSRSDPGAGAGKDRRASAYERE